MQERKRLGEILVELQVLTQVEVDNILWALRRRGGMTKFGQVAREMGLVREEHILAALAVQLQLFPDVQQMSLRKLLGKLSGPTPSAPSKPMRRPASLAKK